jgi:hypothetical protein
MSSPKSRRARPRAEWEALVAEWRAGDLSQQAFAKRKGLAPTTLSWWACRLRREARAAHAPARLVPVRVTGAAARETEFVVRLRAGVEVTVPASFDADALRRLVATLEAPTC